MDISEATQVLLRETLEEDGTYTRLRLGANPGVERIKRLRLALRILWRDLSTKEYVPRGVAFACGIILRFAEECYNNISTTTDAAETSRRDCEHYVRDLTQGAFDVLAGPDAEGWVIPRRDLGEAE